MSATVDQEVEKKEAEKQLESFLINALRTRGGIFEDLIAQHLALAVGADILLKIRLVCEVAMMIPRDIIRRLRINDEELEILYRVTMSLLCSQETSKGSYSIGWAFKPTKENYKKYVEPWHGEVEDPIKFLKDTYMSDLHPAVFIMLKAEFATWAWPKVMKLFEKLSTIVEPELYREILKIVRGRES